MIVGLTGVIAGGGISGFPPYGTLLSSSCTETTITDVNSTQFTGFYNKQSIYADGIGGTYTTNDTGVSPCHYPYGFYFANSSTTVDLYWEGCSNTGTLYGAGTQIYSQMADGSGGIVTTDYTSWTNSDGYYIYDNGIDCRVIFSSAVGSPYYYVENYGTPCASYGTKSGTPYWVDGEFAGLYQLYADGMCGTYESSWDNNPPYPLYGVQMAVPTYSNGAYDANGVYYEGVAVWTYTYSDGTGGTYNTTVLNLINYSGFALTATGVDTSNYDMMWFAYNSSNDPVYPWRYGFMAADGYGGSYFQTVTPSYYTILSPYFYEYWSGNGGYIYADGNGGYFFNASSPP